MQVDLGEAKKVIEVALIDAKTGMIASNIKYKSFIDMILESEHKTYKYILITALLSKATNENINALALQAGSSLEGAYDARSVCHKVIVPFEMEQLGRALGGSNEPFLNKPARATELSKGNPVRKGRDTELLYALCDNLPLINSKEAYESLVYAIKLLLEKSSVLKSYSDINVISSNSIEEIKRFTIEAASQTLEGESLALVIGGIYEMFMNSISDDYNVEVHPVNQSGASSREISDIDIYKGNKLFITNELKDKVFHVTDVLHAVRKVQENQFNKIMFIKGLNGRLDDGNEKELEERMLREGFYLKFCGVIEFTEFMLALIEKPDINIFYSAVINNAMEKKFKESTINFIAETAGRYGWLNK